MDRKSFIFAIGAGIACGGLFLLCSIIRQSLLPDFWMPIVPLLIVFIPFILAGITVVFVQKTTRKPKDTLAEGAVAGAVIGVLQVVTLMLISALTDYQMHGEYTSSNSGLFLIGYCCVLGSAPMAVIGAIAGALATAGTLIALKLTRSFKGK